MRDEIKIELGGVTGMVAPLIGKQPPDIQIWIIGGEAPAFVKEEGFLYQGGTGTLRHRSDKPSFPGTLPKNPPLLMLGRTIGPSEISLSIRMATSSELQHAQVANANC